VTLAGQGFDSILWLDPTLTGPALVNGDGDLRDVTLRDFVIEGATASSLPSDPNADRRRRARPRAPARAGIQLVAKHDGRIEGVRLEHLVVRNCTATGVRIEGASGVVVDACDFSDNGSMAPDGAASPHNLELARVTDCTISASCLDTSPLGSGVDVRDSRAVTVAGNEAARNRRSGIRVAGSRDVHIRGNLAEGNLRGGIVVEADQDREGGRLVDVRDNLARNNGEHGIEIAPSGGARLEGNTERDNGRVE
jgi:parallel beta-helix repeat protein